MALKPLDPVDYPKKETSGCRFLTYTLSCGFGWGMLGQKTVSRMSTKHKHVLGDM